MMFTGIIEQVGSVRSLSSTQEGRRLLVDPCGWGHRPRVGDSISVAGCCLTVAEEVEKAGGLLAFDVVPETLEKTSIGGWKAGRRVNLEHAATAGTLLGGHVVQGHVDGVGKVEKNEQIATAKERPGEEGWVLRVGLAKELMAYMVPKGSVALDGVSLTLAAVDVEGSAIEIALIPTTLAKTTLHELRPGDSINVEADVMAKTVVHYLKHFGAHA